MSFNDEHTIETYKSLISISTEALKTLQLLNGGAIVAFLAYLGQVSSRPELAVHAKLPLSLFVLGLVCGSAAFVTSYLTQLALYEESVGGQTYKGPKHQIWLWLTFVIALVSVAAFAFGAFAGVNALSQHACQ
jgi:hypothetical protein